jgi:hypothetical protein
MTSACEFIMTLRVFAKPRRGSEVREVVSTDIIEVADHGIKENSKHFERVVSPVCITDSFKAKRMPTEVTVRL